MQLSYPVLALGWLSEVLHLNEAPTNNGVSEVLPWICTSFRLGDHQCLRLTTLSLLDCVTTAHTPLQSGVASVCGKICPSPPKHKRYEMCVNQDLRVARPVALPNE
ncbi:hypothetical protein BDW75DRAFT_162381 [Aspergillus navahoensis]